MGKTQRSFTGFTYEILIRSCKLTQIINNANFNHKNFSYRIFENHTEFIQILSKTKNTDLQILRWKYRFKCGNPGHCPSLLQMHRFAETSYHNFMHLQLLLHAITHRHNFITNSCFYCYYHNSCAEKYLSPVIRSICCWKLHKSRQQSSNRFCSAEFGSSSTLTCSPWLRPCPPNLGEFHGRWSQRTCPALFGSSRSIRPVGNWCASISALS